MKRKKGRKYEEKQKLKDMKRITKTQKIEEINARIIIFTPVLRKAYNPSKLFSLNIIVMILITNLIN